MIGPSGSTGGRGGRLGSRDSMGEICMGRLSLKHGVCSLKDKQEQTIKGYLSSCQLNPASFVC